jgi:hypothetical protein
MERGALVHLPAVSEWSDFDDRHSKTLWNFPPIELTLEHDRAE